MKALQKALLFALATGLVVGCHKQQSQEDSIYIQQLTSISILDRNGMSEIINNPERLEQYALVDFTQAQPFQKVMRIYSRDCQGNIPAIITSYHPNGTPKQYLEAINTRAFGVYREWHSNGQLKLEGRVIEGTADIASGCEKDWVFDGSARAWNECGTIEAEIYYDKGILSGTSLYYHSNGNVWQIIPFCESKIEGFMEAHYEDGSMLLTSCFVKGIKHGVSQRFWQNGQLAYDEEYCEGLLNYGKYYDSSGTVLCTVENGNGTKAVFGKECVCEYQEYKLGLLDGIVEVLDRYNRIIRTYTVHNDTKHGEEIIFYDAPKFQEDLSPKISISWYDGKIQGSTKTWYLDGVQESQREMSNNKKNGHCTAWYRDGSLMMIEEYEQDKLVRGEYYGRGEKYPVSMVVDGKGIATKFDPDGTFVQRIPYKQGKPQLDD